ncbi:Ig-like domain-containing protein [Paludisphaera soli]|uniref:Ig-like domain-containing protein n=1 Tax=Paludisphaera soli TaxID=2712865 RepID=UPI0013ED113E|nr:Ig-like domain-containing protein [Paludisphaera soli]
MRSLIRVQSPRLPARRSRCASRLRPGLDALEHRRLLAAPGLTLNILADSIAANAGPGATSGTITRTSADVSQSLTVSLTSSAPYAAAVPGSVVIPAGQASATFAVGAPTGNATPGNQVVTITGSATVDGVFGRDASFGAAAPGFGANAVAAQADGKIIAAGTYYTGVSSNYNNFAVRRYNPDGSPDATFRNGSAAVYGKVGRTMTAQAVAVQPDGKILVGGYYQDQGASSWNMQLARLTADGQLDRSFGADGWVSLVPTSGSYNEIWALAVAADGKILIGGAISNASTYADFAVARLDSTGSLDPTFGSGGYATTSFAVGGDRGYGLGVQPDGRILLAGTSFGGNSTSNFAVARWTADGRLDPTFGSGGKVQTDVPGSFDQARGLALQPDGKIVVTGSSGADMALVRYTTTGALDGSFGAGGIVVKDLGGYETASSVVLQGDGRIVVGGLSDGAAPFRPVSRFAADGSYLGSASGTAVNAMALQPGGRIVVVGGSPNAGYLDAYAGSSTVTAGDAVTVIGTQVPTAGGDAYGAQKSTTLAVAAPGVLANDASPSGRTLAAVLVAGPSRGSLSLHPDGSFAYAPYGSYLGFDTFSYRVTDGVYTSNVATVGLSVAGVNDAPASGDDSYELVTSGQTSQLRIQAPGVLANDGDPNGQPITASLASSPTHGTVALNPDGSFTYTPTGGFYGVDRFTYRASDGALGGVPATVSITVYGRPTAVSESYSTPQDTPLTVASPGVLGNDVSPNGLPLRPYVSAAPNNGTLALNPDGSFTYTPRAGFVGRDAFAYYVYDGKQSSATVVDTIDVAFVDRPPFAGDDAYSYRPGSPLTVAAPGVLANDGDPDGRPVTASVVTQPAHGSLTLNADGSFTYTAAAGWIGPDAFTYKVRDGELESAIATVRLIVADSSGNQWTQRGGDAGHSNYVDARIDATGIAAAWSQPLNYASVGYWAQSGNRAVAIDDMHVYRTDLDGYWASGEYHIIAYDLRTGAPVWNRVVVGNGPVSAPSIAAGKVYVNRSGHSGISGGTDADRPWIYQLDARTGATLLRQTYSAQWDSDERPAIAGDQLVAPDGYYGGFSAWTASSLARQWNNPGSQSESPMAAFDDLYVYAYGNKVYSRTTGAYQGEVAPPAGMSWVGSPVVSGSGRLLFNVRDSLNYPARFGVSSYDAERRTPRWTVVLPAAPAGKAVGNGVVAVAAGAQLILLDEATGAQINTWDAPDSLNSEIVLTRTHAFVQASNYGYSRVYAINLATGQPEWSYENRTAGEDGGTFMEMAFGGGHLLLSNDAFVTAFAVPGAPNGGPVAADDSYTTAQGSSLTIAAPGVLGNDGDADGDSLSAALVGGPANGVVALGPGGSFVYTPAPGFVGVDRFTYRANDGRSSSNVATVTVVVDATPTASGQAVSLVQGDSKAITLAAADPDDAALTYTIVAGPAHGTLTGSAPNLVYTPHAGYAGPDGFTFAASDGRSSSAPAAVTIDVKPALALTWNDPAGIVYGTPLGSSQLNATANIRGEFAYSPGFGAILGAGAGRVLTANFVPYDPDYRATSVQARIDVLKATPTLTWSVPAPITYGTPLGSSQLNATASVPGGFAYTPGAGAILNAGPGQRLSATFTPADAANFNGVVLTTSIDVLKATPTITWAAQAAIVYGTPLGPSQLNATASAPGAFSYSPAAGTVLRAGAGRVLSVAFSPADSANYTTVGLSTTIDVRKATLTVAPASKDMGRGDAMPALSYAISGFVPGDLASVVSGAPALTTTATTASAAGRYPITAAVGTLAAADYDFRLASGTMTIHPKVLDVRVRWGSRSMSLMGPARPLPFANITAVDVVFSDDVNASLANLSLASTATAGKSYRFDGFGFDPSTDTATWTLPTALGVDRLMLALDDKFGALVDPTISVWNAAPVRFDVLPGDVDGDGRVSNSDLNFYKKPPSHLLLWMDMDGDGDVDKADRDWVSRRIGTRLP